MLKKFLCIYIVAASSFMGLQASETQTEKVVVSKEIAAGALACDLNEEKCSNCEEPIIEEVKAETKLAGCSKCKKRNRRAPAPASLLACEKCK